MKVLLTGAAGFVGSHVARALVHDGCEVHALVRPSSDLWRIQDVVPALHLVRCDLSASDELDAHLRKIQPELCVHLAWHTAPPGYSTAPENLEMLAVSLGLASRLAELGCRRFVGVGTCFEYDTSLGYLSETSRTRPLNLYGASKLALQVVLEQFSTTSGMEVAWARLFYLYGPSEREQRLVPSVICSLLRNELAKATKGEQVRDFLHVADAAAAIWAVAQSDLLGSVNVGSGQPVTVEKMVTTVGTILGRPDLVALGALPYNPADPMFVCADNRRLTENTNWVPRFDLASGLRDTAEWWREALAAGSR